MLYLNGQKVGFVGGGGHTIKNDSGSDLTQRNNLSIKGTYTKDDSTNDATVVNVTRTMTSQEFNLLSAEEKKGVINVTDEAGVSFSADDIPYDNTSSGLTGDDVQSAIDEISGSIDNLHFYTTTATFTFSNSTMSNPLPLTDFYTKTSALAIKFISFFCSGIDGIVYGDSNLYNFTCARNTSTVFTGTVTTKVLVIY